MSVFKAYYEVKRTLLDVPHYLWCDKKCLVSIAAAR